MKHEEDDHQRAFVKWATLATPRIPQLALLFAVPNGGKREVREAARLKGLGVRAGVPDLMLPVASVGHYRETWVQGGLPYFGLAIEMKSSTGRVTPEQAKWHERLREAGWQVNVCRTWEEAREVVCTYLGVKP